MLASKVLIVNAAFILTLFLLQVVADAGQEAPRDRLTGETFSHVVETGDTLSRIGARYGVDWKVLAAENRVVDPDVLEAGRSLAIDNRHIVPAAPLRTGIVVNIPQRMLFYFEDGRLRESYPVAVGRSETPTPMGRFQVATREEGPVWDVPCSIQEEMRRAGRPVVERVPPGPDNPLGGYWIGLSLAEYGIHGTNDPGSIYGFRTHGCVRLHPDDIDALFSRVPTGTPVHLTGVDGPVNGRSRFRGGPSRRLRSNGRSQTGDRTLAQRSGT